MPFIGQQPVTGAYHKLDSITTSATATYNLQLNGGAYSPASANHLLVSLNGVIQAPQDSFTVSGSTITFASALTSSDSIDFIMALGDVLSVGVPTDGSVNTSQLANSAVTDAKIASGITSSKLTGALPAIDGSALTNVPFGMVKIYDAALTTGTSFQQIDNLFTDDYDNYHMNLSVSLAADGYFYFRFTDSSDAEIGSGSGEYGYSNMEIDSASTFSSNTSSAAYPIRNGVTVTGGAGNESVGISADIIGVRQSTTPASIHGHATNFNANGTHEAYTFVCGLRPDYFQVVNGLTLTANQNFDGGRISIFGYKTS